MAGACNFYNYNKAELFYPFFATTVALIVAAIGMFWPIIPKVPFRSEVLVFVFNNPELVS